MVVNKADLLVKRDNEGKLIPQLVTIDGLGEFKLAPLTRGDLFKIGELAKTNPLEADTETIMLCCIEPSLTREEISNMKAGFTTKISSKILEISGIEIGSGQSFR
jgi:hypothetical protein